jgi:hypothetical protein
VDRGALTAWLVARQFCATADASGTARGDALSRAGLVGERARLVNRIQKVLEDSNVKLASVATDITGVSGRAILQALLAGQDDPKALAELARGRRRSKRDELAQAVQGTLSEHHRFPALEPAAPAGGVRQPDRRTGSGDCASAGCAGRPGRAWP